MEAFIGWAHTLKCLSREPYFNFIYVQAQVWKGEKSFRGHLVIAHPLTSSPCIWQTENSCSHFSKVLKSMTLDHVHSYSELNHPSDWWGQDEVAELLGLFQTSKKLPKIDPGLVCWSDLLVWDSNMPWPTCSNKVYLQKLATSISYFCEHTLINCCQKSIVVFCSDVLVWDTNQKPERPTGGAGEKASPMSAALEQLDAKKWIFSKHFLPILCSDEGTSQIT